MSLIYSNDFIKYLSTEKRSSQHTTMAYMRDLNIFYNFIKKHVGEEPTKTTLKKLDEEALQAFLSHSILKEKVSKQTVNRRLSSVKSFFKWLQKKEILRNDRVFLVKNMKAEKAPPKAISPQEVVKILQTVRPPQEGASMAEKRDFALILAMYGLGVRISEALQLNVEDIKNDRIIILGKGGKERSLPVPKPVRAALENLAQSVPYNERAKVNPLFVNQRMGERLTPRTAQLILKKVRQRLGLPEHLTPHTLRHCFATHLLENGADIRTLQELLGHASINATERYLAINSKELKKVHDQAHPNNRNNV